MTPELTARANQIIDRVTDKSFLAGEGIGNEIACYIFDYPCREELAMRNHIEWMMARFASHHSEMRVLHLDLFEVIRQYLVERSLFDKATAMQAAKGDEAVIKALKGPLAAEKLRSYIAKAYTLSEHDLLLISGVGRVWPMMRVHGLLNSLHTVMDQVTMVMFYPGTYDGTSLKLFEGRTSNDENLGVDAYYRAFQLIPHETHL